MNTYRYLSTILFCLFFFVNTGTAQHVFPGETWPTSTPEAEGVDPEAIEAIHDDMLAGKIIQTIEEF